MIGCAQLWRETLINIELEIRKLVATTAMGEVGSIRLTGIDYEKAKLTAIKFSRLKKYPILVLGSKPDQLSIRRVTAEAAKTVMYPEMDTLEIGSSHLFELARPLHQRVRMAASARNRRGAVLLSCAQDGPFIRVTRHPLTTDEMKTHGPVQEVVTRSSKYRLERLETEREIRFRPENHAEVLRIRASVSTKGKLTGWKLACRSQFDGSMTVTRLDLQSTKEAS